MNIKLVYRSSEYKVDIMKETICQYLYKVCEKAFQLPQNDIILLYNKIKIKNDSQLILDVMGFEDNIPQEEIITVKKIIDNKEKSKISNRNFESEKKKLPLISSPIFDSPQKLNLKKNKIKRQVTRCQVCNYKEAIFYCRTCNLFVCFECNVRYSEHHGHKTINLEDGDIILGFKTYKEKILSELNLVNLGYNKYKKWVFSGLERDSFINYTFKLLEKLRKYSNQLSNINSFYSLDKEMIDNLKIEIDKTIFPQHKEEYLEAFLNLNSKDKEVENHIKCVNLQIIQTEYNKILTNYIKKIQNNLQKLIKEVQNKLNECEDMKFWGINEIKIYLKNNNDGLKSKSPFHIKSNNINIESLLGKIPENEEPKTIKKNNKYNDDNNDDIQKDDINSLIGMHKESSDSDDNKEEENENKTINCKINNIDINDSNKKENIINSLSGISNKKTKIKLKLKKYNDDNINNNNNNCDNNETIKNLKPLKGLRPIVKRETMKSPDINKDFSKKFNFSSSRNLKIGIKDFISDINNNNVQTEDNVKQNKQSLENPRSRNSIFVNFNNDKEEKTNKYLSTDNNYPLIVNNIFKQQIDQERINMKVNRKSSSILGLKKSSGNLYAKKLYHDLNKKKSESII